MRGTRGRILPHERDHVVNSVPIMGAKFTDLGNNYNDLYNEMLQHDMKDIIRKDTSLATCYHEQQKKLCSCYSLQYLYRCE
jgi:hypothetical protein